MTHSPCVANTQPGSKRRGFQAGEYTLREQLRAGHLFELLEIDEDKNHIPAHARV